MKLFSFCIYGTDMKYYLGLEENLRIINEFYPEYYTYIYCGSNRNDDFLKGLPTKFSNVKLIDTGKEGTVNMIYRYSPLTLDDVERVIVRDADSEINPRDRWCIHDFLSSTENTYLCQVIRDHFWHKSGITGGLSHFKIQGDIYSRIKEEFLTVFREIDEGIHHFQYGSDENVLNTRIHPILKPYILVYSNICVFEKEEYRPIVFENNGANFCGNVIEYTQLTPENEFPPIYMKSYKFDYFDYNIQYQIEWLYSQKQYDLIISVINEFGLDRINYSIVPTVLHYLLNIYIDKQNITECLNLYKLFYKFTIHDSIKNTLNQFFIMVKTQGYSVVGTCNVNYQPRETEFVIYFGNYPDDYMGLPQGFQLYRHFIFKDAIPLDRFECDECWNKIDRIFIMGLENEFERMNDTIMQLTLMNAPLNRIQEYRAKKDLDLADVYIGATKNHMDCLKQMMDGEYETCLFLEDDFIFTSNIRENQNRLSRFFERKYDYNICFLSASKQHLREDYDDLLILSKQICTTSSGYLIHRKNVETVYQTVKEGYEALLEHKDQSSVYCIDRYWTKLDKLFIFKQKLGFQKPSRSKITGNLNVELD
jgi:hypothetical protein